MTEVIEENILQYSGYFDSFSDEGIRVETKDFMELNHQPARSGAGSLFHVLHSLCLFFVSIHLIGGIVGKHISV